MNYNRYPAILSKFMIIIGSLAAKDSSASLKAAFDLRRFIFSPA